MKFHVVFTPFALPMNMDLYVKAPSEDAARKFIRREARGCDVVKVEKTEDYTIYAESDENGNRI